MRVCVTFISKSSIGFTSKINTNWSSDDSLQHLGGNL